MIVIEKQGHVVRMTDVSSKKSPPKTLAKRGDINEFSRKSRRRLIDVFARLDVSKVRKTFVTLTFHKIPTPTEAKAAFKRFLSRLTYHYPQVTGVWRVELQKRGSAHYHLILLDLPYVEQAILQDVWTECTREDRSIAHITLIRSKRGVMSYVSKYIAKLDSERETASLINAPYPQNSPPTWNGRHWGYINKAALPFAERQIGVIVDEEVADYFWWLASFHAQKKRAERSTTTRIYTKDAHAIFAQAIKWGGFRVDDCWHELLRLKTMPASTRTKASLFFAGINTHL